MKNHQFLKHFVNIERDFNYLFNKHLKNLGIGKHDVWVLKTIHESVGISQSDVCNVLTEDKMTVSKSVKRLVERGLIEKKKDETDKRITLLQLTEEGLTARQDILSLIEQLNAKLLKGLSVDEKDQVIHLMTKIAQNIASDSTRIN